jgi:hypothetical protein
MDRELLSLQQGMSQYYFCPTLRGIATGNSNPSLRLAMVPEEFVVALHVWLGIPLFSSSLKPNFAFMAMCLMYTVIKSLIVVTPTYE